VALTWHRRHVRIQRLTLVSLSSSGQDATEAFEDVGHSDEARALLPDMLVGDFEAGSVSPWVMHLTNRKPTKE
jgi:cytochrome b involved in lipid metabolism